MRRKNINNQIIRECITEALLILMQKQPFQEITVMELTKKAGVGRVSFYRNYDSKESVLVAKLDEEVIKWWGTFSPTSTKDYITALFEHCLDVKEILILLYKQRLSHLLIENINNCFGFLGGDKDEVAYSKACLSGCVFGVLNEWISRGMVDTPEKMGTLLSNMQPEIESLVRALL